MIAMYGHELDKDCYFIVTKVNLFLTTKLSGGLSTFKRTSHNHT